MSGLGRRVRPSSEVERTLTPSAQGKNTENENGRAKGSHKHGQQWLGHWGPRCRTACRHFFMPTSGLGFGRGSEDFDEAVGDVFVFAGF